MAGLKRPQVAGFQPPRDRSRLIDLLPNAPAHAVPKGLQVRVINPGPLHRLLINQDRLLEPRCAFLETPQLGAVAGQVVGDGPFLGEFVHNRQ